MIFLCLIQCKAITLIGVYLMRVIAYNSNDFFLSIAIYTVGY